MKRFLFVLLLATSAHAQNNLIHVEQIGVNNQFTISQDGTGHKAYVLTGLDAGLDTTTVNITQQGIGSKTAKVELPAGYNNSVAVTQDGSGQHYAGIQTFSGSANSITINQSGASNNLFALTGTGSNNANTINVTQMGNAGADKSFTLNMTSTNGATVTVQQTNMTTANSGSMTINCSSLCGAYSYIRN